MMGPTEVPDTVESNVAASGRCRRILISDSVITMILRI
jgi:hypothetical protein